MTQLVQFANNATSSLASGITNVATSLTVQAGAGASFPTLTGSQYFYCTITDAATRLVREIVKVTARTTDTFTVTRAQEGTTGTAFLANDVVELRLTAAGINDSLDQTVTNQTVGFTITKGTTPKTLTVALDATVSGTNTGDNAVNSTSAALAGSASQAFSASNFTTAQGIKFPATQNPSSDANTLDDYEEYAAAAGACIGAITTSSDWKAVKVGNVVTLTLPAVTGTASAVPSFSYATVLPSAYRPSANLFIGAAVVSDNGAQLAVSGGVFINSGAGAISIYRDGAGTNFTAAATAGLIYSCSVSWVI